MKNSIEIIIANKDFLPIKISLTYTHISSLKLQLLAKKEETIQSLKSHRINRELSLLKEKTLFSRFSQWLKPSSNTEDDSWENILEKELAKYLLMEFICNCLLDKYSLSNLENKILIILETLNDSERKEFSNLLWFLVQEQTLNSDQSSYFTLIEGISLKLLELQSLNYWI